MKKRGVGKFILISALSLVLIFGMECAGVRTGGMGVMRVEAAVKKPALSKKKASINEGSKVTLSVKNPTIKVKWSTSNKNVVKIESTKGGMKQKAVLRGVAKGTATVTAKIGSVKLKAKITVKHVHAYTPATCTQPAKCAKCGAVSGAALGHDMTQATCMKQEQCRRCKALGAYGAHNYSDGYCITRGCDEVDVNYWLPMYIENPYNIGNVWLYVGNYLSREVTVGDIQYTATRPYAAKFYPGGSGTPVEAILMIGNETVRRGVVPAQSAVEIQWLRNERALISANAKLEYDISFVLPPHGSVANYVSETKTYKYHIIAGVDVTRDEIGLYGMSRFTRIR